MPSPFPGMDPYLEAASFWGGFHGQLIIQMQTALNRTLPQGYYAENDQYVWLQADEPDERRILGKPDVFVPDRNGHDSSTGGIAVAPMTAAEPTTTVALSRSRKKTRRYLKVVAPDHRTVVTIVELLSPSNKYAGPDRDRYLQKRDEVLAAGTNLVEIDLLRAGGRMPMGTPPPPDADYYAFICRAAEYPRAAVWAWTVRDPIPNLPVPLKPDDPAAVLPLQGIVSEIYDTSRYAQRVDYAVPPSPALRPIDAAWATGLMTRGG